MLKDTGLHLESCGSQILRRIKNSVNWGLDAAFKGIPGDEPDITRQLRQAIYEAKEPAFTFAKASLE